VFADITLTSRHPVTATPTAPATTLGDLDALFRGFADPTRIRILNLLAAGALCVCDIVDILALPQSTVSRHLGYLRRSRLVEVDRGARYDHYRLAEPGSAVHRSLLESVKGCFQDIGSLAAERARADARVGDRKASPC
jgi:ArsR family transcriptional regulator